MSDSTTEALPVEVGRLLAFVPAELVIDAKTRRDVEATVTAGFVAGLREYAKRSAVYPSAHTEGEKHPCGNHSPIAVMTTADGRLKVRVGRRRTLGCGRAGVAVLGYNVGPEGDTAAEQRAALVDAWTENHDREGTTPADDAVLVEALFEIKGTTETQVARALRLHKDEVKAYRVVARSQVARDALEAGLDLIQSAAVEEFAGDSHAVARLTLIAQTDPDGFGQELAELRATRAVRAAREAFTAELAADGYQIREEGYIPWRLNLTNLRGPDGAELTVEQHATCPGRAVNIDVDWDWPSDDAKAAFIAANPDVEMINGDPAVEFGDDIEAQQAGMVPVWRVDGHLCTDPAAYGHLTYDQVNVRDAKTPAEPGAAEEHEDPEAVAERAAHERAEAAAREQAEQTTERRRVRERNTLWRAATETRLAHLRDIAARAKLAPKELKVAAARLRAEAIARHETQPQMASFGHRVAAQLLRLQGSEWDSENLILAALDAASPDRHEVIELVMVLAAAEHGMSGVDGKEAETWRQAEQSWWARVETPPLSARYLRWLRDHTGYRLAPIEAEVILAAFPDDAVATEQATGEAGGDADISWRRLPDDAPDGTGGETAAQVCPPAQDAEIAPPASAIDTGEGLPAEETEPDPAEEEREWDSEDSSAYQDRVEAGEAEAAEAD
jgi:hypothetical protein